MQSVFCAAEPRTNTVAKPAGRATSIRPGTDRPPLPRELENYLICIPEIAREMTRRWISEVPSKIV